MLAGPLDRRIRIERVTRTRSGALNEAAESWAELATVWASYTPTSDGERQRAAETAAVIDARFRIRWSPTVRTVDATDRVVFDGRTFNILGVKEIGRREGLELSCQARAER